MEPLTLDRALDPARRLADRVAGRLVQGTPLLGALPDQPPTVRGSVILGNKAEVWEEPLDFFVRLMMEHGPLVRLRFGTTFYYVMNDPDLVRHVFVENYKNYRKSKYYKPFKVVVGEGLTTSEGDFWRKQRKLMQPGFHREAIAGFATAMSEATRETIAHLRGLAGEPVRIDKELARLALRIVGRTLFSTSFDADADELGWAMGVANEFGASGVSLPLWVPTRKNRDLKRALRVFDSLIARTIGQRRRRGGGDERDLLAMLMATRDETTGEGMSDRQLRDEALTLVIAGHETTASVLVWTLYLLSLHPEIEKKLRAHVLSVLGDRDPTADDVPKLAYTAQVVQESMRMFPPGWALEREAIADDVLAGYRIPAGSTVAMSPYALHRHPAHWSNPEGFDPDRFQPEEAQARSRHVYVPFGAGPRVCIGNTMSMMEMVIVVSMIVRSFRLELVPGQRVEIEPLATTLRPKGGLRMTPRLVEQSPETQGRVPC